MVETLLVGGLIGITLLILFILLPVQIHQRGFARLQAQQRAWERAHDARQLRWLEHQEKHITTTAKKLSEQVEQLRTEWQGWKAQDIERAGLLVRQSETAIAQLRIESELARLPRVEDMPLPVKEQTKSFKQGNQWRAPNLQDADLSGRDLSYRYLAQANLRNANLAKANLFMADLSGACLVGANLTRADLGAANLSGVDLRGANLTETNMLVSDLQAAILLGTDLRAARNLTAQQLATAILDNTTKLSCEVANALSHKPHSSTPLNGHKPMNFAVHEKPDTTPLPDEPETPLPDEPETPLPESSAADTRHLSRQHTSTLEKKNGAGQKKETL